VGLLTPHSLFLALGISDIAHQGIAIAAGGVFGLMVIVGGAMLWLRRMFNPRVRAASRWMDINILGWLVMTALVGFSTIFWSISHAQHGDASVMIRLAEWVQSIVTLQPNPELLRGVDTVFKIHIFFGLSVFLFFPFTRLVHIWSAPSATCSGPTRSCAPSVPRKGWNAARPVSHRRGHPFPGCPRFPARRRRAGNLGDGLFVDGLFVTSAPPPSSCSLTPPCDNTAHRGG
jgi:hypothetical protein